MFIEAVNDFDSRLSRSSVHEEQSHDSRKRSNGDEFLLGEAVSIDDSLRMIGAIEVASKKLRSIWVSSLSFWDLKPSQCSSYVVSVGLRVKGCIDIHTEHANFAALVTAGCEDLFAEVWVILEEAELHFSRVGGI